MLIFVVYKVASLRIARSCVFAQISLLSLDIIAVDSSGNLYIADTDNQRVRKIAGTTITIVAGNGDQYFSGDGASATSAGLDSPNGVAVDSNGNIYVSDTHNQRVRVVNASGNISTLAGNGSKAYSGDGGAASAASLARPRGLSVDAQGNVYVADSGARYAACSCCAVRWKLRAVGHA